MNKRYLCLFTLCSFLAAAADGPQQPSPPASQKPAKAESEGNTGGDTTPSGMVAFFMTTACPSGWTVPPLVQGRLVVGVTASSAVGVTVGTALANQTPPNHSHPYTANLTMDYKSVSAAKCCNNSGAGAKTYSVPGTLASNTANLPFIQLVVCQKQ